MSRSRCLVWKGVAEAPPTFEQRIGVSTSTKSRVSKNSRTDFMISDRALKFCRTFGFSIWRWHDKYLLIQFRNGLNMSSHWIVQLLNKKLDRKVGNQTVIFEIWVRNVKNSDKVSGFLAFQNNIFKPFEKVSTIFLKNYFFLPLFIRI